MMLTLRVYLSNRWELLREIQVNNIPVFMLLTSNIPEVFLKLLLTLYLELQKFTIQG